jgi:HPt (histidine-containing phosphotransfer) domain-containing protein
MTFEFILTDGEITIDMSVLEGLIDDDPSIIKPIIELFLTNVPETIEKMNLYYKLEDWENLYKTAHYLKSSISVIKVDTLYESVLEIERKAKNQVELDSIDPVIKYIELQYDNAEKLLRKELIDLLDK